MRSKQSTRLLRSQIRPAASTPTMPHHTRLKPKHTIANQLPAREKALQLRQRQPTHVRPAGRLLPRPCAGVGRARRRGENGTHPAAAANSYDQARHGQPEKKKKQLGARLPTSQAWLHRLPPLTYNTRKHQRLRQGAGARRS